MKYYLQRRLLVLRNIFIHVFDARETACVRISWRRVVRVPELAVHAGPKRLEKCKNPLLVGDVVVEIQVEGGKAKKEGGVR